MPDDADFSDATFADSFTSEHLQTDQQLFLRKCTLLVTNQVGQGFDLSNLRVQFRVQSQTLQTLKNAEITVLNLAPATAQQIFSLKEFTQVTLSAGYESGLFGPIFTGLIAYLKIGKQDALTSYLTIVATDGGDAYQWATINVPLGVNTTPQDQLNAVLAKLKDYNITAGSIPTLPTLPLPRGKVLYDKVTNVLKNLADTVGCAWHFSNGKLNFVPVNVPLPGDVIVLTPQTGLIGTPEQTLNGLNLRALLNPRLVTGRQIQVKMSQTNQLAYNAAPQPYYAAMPLLPALAVNGLYVVYSLTHEGDTRGGDWVSEIVAINLAPGTPVPTAYQQTAVLNGA